MAVLAPAHLRADFQQFYNLNIDDMGERYSLAHASDCAALLPAEARVWQELGRHSAGRQQKNDKEAVSTYSTSKDEYMAQLGQEWREVEQCRPN